MMINPKLPALHTFLLSIGFEVREIVIRPDGLSFWTTVLYRFQESTWTLDWNRYPNDSETWDAPWTLDWNRYPNDSETWDAPHIPSGAPTITQDCYCFTSAVDCLERKNRHPSYEIPVWRKELAARIRAVEAPPHGQSSIL